MTQSHVERTKAYEAASKKNIVDVAHSLGMKLVSDGQSYHWAEHDSFVIVPKKNFFYWNSRGFGGGTIKLVQTIKDCSYKEAVSFLNEGDLKEFSEINEPKRESFNYYMKEDKGMIAAKEYLKEVRKISDETINFFVSQGVIAQSIYKNKDTLKTEPVIVFKHLDHKGHVKGVSLQGINEDWHTYPKKGRLKKTFGDGFSGMVVRVGTPPAPQEASKERPLRIIAFESPIDLMSYYELFNKSIGDAILVSMNGVRKGTISKCLANEIGSRVSEDEKNTVLDEIENRSTGKTDAIKIYLAVDNDEAGKHFIEEFGITAIPVIPQLPKLLPGKTTSDWNDWLKYLKKKQATHFEKRVEQANIQKVAILTKTDKEVRTRINPVVTVRH